MAAAAPRPRQGNGKRYPTEPSIRDRDGKTRLGRSRSIAQRKARGDSPDNRAYRALQKAAAPGFEALHPEDRETGRGDRRAEDPRRADKLSIEGGEQLFRFDRVDFVVHRYCRD
jgi:hypothetical protein